MLHGECGHGARTLNLEISQPPILWEHRIRQVSRFDSSGAMPMISRWAFRSSLGLDKRQGLILNALDLWSGCRERYLHGICRPLNWKICPNFGCTTWYALAVPLGDKRS
jgi:hypothetical protein